MSKIIPFFVIILISSPVFAQDKKILIKQIEMKGNRKIDTQTLYSKLRITTGDPFSPEAVQKEIKNLYGLGYFDQIEVQTEPFEGGISLLFLFYEKPVLVDLSFEGNTAIGTERLKEKLPARLQTLIDQEAISIDVEKIRALYEKEAYYQAQIIPVLNRISEEKAALTFLIREGDQAYIRRIRWEGVSAFKERRLKKAINTKEYFWLTSWFSESGRYREGELDSDVERIRDFYLNRGYLQAQVGKPTVTISEDKKWFDVTFSVVEGDLFKIEKLGYEGNQLFDQTALSRIIDSHAGETVSKEKIGRDIQKIVDRYGEEGYLFAHVSPQVLPNGEKKTVDLTYRIAEDKPYRVREITIRGNDKTRDYVIRREVRQNEQERANTRLLRKSFQRIHNLNFFEKIDILPQKVSDEEVDIDINVTEKSTGTLVIGGGYSSVDKFVGQIEINQGNLFGRGQLLRARAESGPRRTTYSLTFREPYLFDSTYSGQTDIFDQVRTFGQYDEKRLGGDFILGKAFGDHIGASVSYTSETLELSDVRAGAPRFVKEQAALGKTLTSAVGFSLSRDTRDFIFDPKEGSRHSLSLEYAGTFLGGDNDYYKLTVDSGRFFPSFRGHVFSLHGRFGFAEGIGEKALPVGERFFVGGINTVRGFRFGKAGPLTKEGVIAGGNKQLYLNAEYLIPLVSEAGLKSVFFYDIGSAFDDAESVAFSELREGAGFGLRWISPVGPLRFEWGWNIDPKPGEAKVEFEFSIGTLF